MISSVGASTIQSLMTPALRQSAEKPSQLPTQPPGSDVSLSDEAKKLAAAQALTSNPVAVAAVSQNSQIDQLATNIYMGQQAQRMVDTYTQASTPPADSSGGGSGGSRSPVAIAAASQNPEVDELATTVYKSKQAQQMLDMYTGTYQSALPGSTIEESA